MEPRRYTTYERDANGGDEAMMRRYESKLTRFAQPDPSDGSYELSDPQSFNRYSYTQDDPVNYVDPSGLMMNCSANYVYVSNNGDGGWSYRGEICYRLLDDWYNGPKEPPIQEGDDPYFGLGEPPQPPTPAKCDERIARIFGGPGAVVATVNEPPGIDVGMSGGRYRYDHLAGQGVFHIYTDAHGSPTVTGLYTPPGGRLVSGGEYDNKGSTENFFRYRYDSGPYRGVEIAFVHVGGTHGGKVGGQFLGSFRGERNSMGSIRIGNIAGPGGESKGGYNHTHVKVYRNGRLTDPRKVFC